MVFLKAWCDAQRGVISACLAVIETVMSLFCTSITTDSALLGLRQLPREVALPIQAEGISITLCERAFPGATRTREGWYG